MNICVFVPIHYQADMQNLVFRSFGAAKGRYSLGPQKKNKTHMK